MSYAAPSLADQAWSRDLLERQVSQLGELADMGMEIARCLKDKALTAEDPAPASAAYAKVARAVRQSLLLREKMIKDIISPHNMARADGKRRVQRIITRIATREGHDTNAADRISREALERLEADDLYGDVVSQPISDIVTAICKDLGLTPDWPKLSEEAWLKDEMKSPAPNSFPPRVAQRRGPPEGRLEGGPRSGGWGLSGSADTRQSDKTEPNPEPPQATQRPHPPNASRSVPLPQQGRN